ncbi:MAG: type IV secretory system conjugative DNA transfer family protein [Firmicutes bacterium]|nr:type IV secretory system conjugative DNA transfer family protein [Bacillota bacterium]
METVRLNGNRLSTKNEFIQTLTGQDLNSECNLSGVPFYYENGIVYTDTTDAHTLIFGNTGSKKTRNFCIPSVYTLGMAGESMIISDPKGEIYRNTSGFLAHKGYTIKTLNLREPEKSSRWNPLMLPYRYYKNGNADKAIEMISDLCAQLKAQVHSERDLYWENQAADLLMGMILMLFESEDDEKKIHMESIQRMRMYIEIEDTSETRSSIFWDLIRTFSENSLVRYKLASVYTLRNVEKTLNCVVSTFDSMLRSFIFNEKLMDLINANEIGFGKITEEKTALYLITPDEKTTYHFLISVFVKQCYENLIDKAKDCRNGILPIRVNFILDEFSNFPKIADMPAMISAARSRNIRFVLVVQSKQQLLAEYGDDAETIKSNCKNWVYLSCRELNLLKEIEQLCGSVEIDEREYPLLTITQLQRLQIGWEDSEALVLRSGIAPYISRVKDFSVYPQVGYDVYNIPLPWHEKVSCFSVLKCVHDKLTKELEETKDTPTIEDLFN